jgi:valyl-tRNA synthetase
MSKSKGNVVDPLGLIDRFGADALRFFMAAMESQGRDVKMDEARVEGYRNFATKLWNAVRFAQANGIGASDTVRAPDARLPLNRWLIGEVVETARAIEQAMADLRFDAAANAIYAFVWDRFCDWYLELAKPVLAAGGAEADESRRVAGWAIDQILVMLHPVMPFITEELWHAQGTRSYPLIVAQWPNPRAEADPAAAAEIGWLIALIGGVRTAKAELGIAPGTRLTAHAPDADAAVRAMAARNAPMLDRLARLDALSFDPSPPGAAAALVIGGATYALPLDGIIDVAAERARLDKALAAAVKERDSLGQRLANPAFAAKAKPEAVEKARADHAARVAEAERLEAALARIG